MNMICNECSLKETILCNDCPLDEWREKQEKIESIRQRMCDEYCKWQGMPVQRVLYDICNKCPMNELEVGE